MTGFLLTLVTLLPYKICSNPEGLPLKSVWFRGIAFGSCSSLKVLPLKSAQIQKTCLWSLLDLEGVAFEFCLNLKEFLFQPAEDLPLKSSKIERNWIGIHVNPNFCLWHLLKLIGIPFQTCSNPKYSPLKSAQIQKTRLWNLLKSKGIHVQTCSNPKDLI